MGKTFRQFRDLFRNYRFQSMFFSYFRSIALISFAFFALFGFVAFHIYEKSTRESVSYYMERSLSKSADQLGTLTQSIDQNHYVISDTNDVLLFLLEDRETLNNTTDRKLQSSLSNLLFYMTVGSPGIDSIYLYSPGNEYFASWTELRPLSGYHDAAWADKIKPGSHSCQFARGRKASEALDTVSFIKAVEMNGKILGYAVYNVDMTYFYDLSGQEPEPASEILSVLNRDGQVLFSTEQSLIGGTLDEADPRYSLYEQTLQNGGGIVFPGQAALASALAANEQYVLISDSHEGAGVRTGNNNLTIIVFGGLSGLLISLILSFIVSLRMYHYIVRLISFMNAPQEGETLQASGEIQYISGRIISVMDRSKSIEKELTSTLLKLKKAQAIALLTQINPHFILNSLQLVNLDIMRELRRDTMATRINSLLSDIIRSNLNTTDYMVPCEEEVALARKYLEIENIRNMGRLQVKWELDDTLLTCKTVKFLLQPLLENCILHGLKSKKEFPWEIRISLYEQEGYLYFQVSDNGVGMSWEDTEQLRERLRENRIQENSHIGLCNVNQRIRLVFGEDCGLSVESTPGKSTTITAKQKILRLDAGS